MSKTNSCPFTGGKHASQDSPCTECIKGSIHAGLPQGVEGTIHGLNTYIVGNRTNPRAIIVVYSDIFGLPLPNNKLICDAYAASNEFLVYMPDFFKGDPVPLKTADVLIPVDASKQSTLSKYGGMLAAAPQFAMWMARHKYKETNQTCMDFLRALRTATPSSRKIGMVGFCWGGRYALRAGLEENMIEKDGQKIPLVDAVIAFHPSNLSLPDDVERLVVPASIGWGLKDSEVNIETKTKVEEAHANVRKAGHVVPEVEHRVFEPGRHGFAVRGNPEDPQEKKELVDSEKQALDWMQRWL